MKFVFRNRISKSKELPAGTIVRRIDGWYQKVGKEWKRIHKPHEYHHHEYPTIDPAVEVESLMPTSKKWASLNNEQRDAVKEEVLEDIHALFHHGGDTKKFWKEWVKTFGGHPSDDHKRIVETVANKMRESAQKPAPEHVTEPRGVAEESRGAPEAKPVVSHGGEQHVVHTPVEPRGVAEYPELPKEEAKLPTPDRVGIKLPKPGMAAKGVMDDQEGHLINVSGSFYFLPKDSKEPIPYDPNKNEFHNHLYWLDEGFSDKKDYDIIVAHPSMTAIVAGTHLKGQEVWDRFHGRGEVKGFEKAKDGEEKIKTEFQDGKIRLDNYGNLLEKIGQSIQDKYIFERYEKDDSSELERKNKEVPIGTVDFLDSSDGWYKKVGAGEWKRIPKPSEPEEPETIKTIKVKAKIKRVRNIKIGELKGDKYFIHDNLKTKIQDINEIYEDESRIVEVSPIEFSNATSKFIALYGFPPHYDKETDELWTVKKEDGGVLIGYKKDGKRFVHEEFVTHISDFHTY